MDGAEIPDHQITGRALDGVRGNVSAIDTVALIDDGRVQKVLAQGFGKGLLVEVATGQTSSMKVWLCSWMMELDMSHIGDLKLWVMCNKREKFKSCKRIKVHSSLCVTKLWKDL